ncbi:hypothetical protein R1sor_019327 [Riccia sorocarpa]|uniref:Uncharacterized protein n=1 Tax=Riccia sorocarpa TaxID=122646 RepID=A0ABD3IFU6_9MARC
MDWKKVCWLIWVSFWLLLHRVPPTVVMLLLLSIRFRRITADLASGVETRGSSRPHGLENGDGRRAQRKASKYRKHALEQQTAPVPSKLAFLISCVNIMNLEEVKVLIGLALSGKLLSFLNVYWKNRVRMWFKYFCATRLQHFKFRSLQSWGDDSQFRHYTELEEVPLKFRARFCCLPFKLFELDCIGDEDDVLPCSLDRQELVRSLRKRAGWATRI